MKDKKELTDLQKEIQRRIIYLIDKYCDGSQQTFADKVHIGKSSVSQYVNGTNFPNNLRVGEIAHAFSISPAWIMGYDVPMIPRNNAEIAVKDADHLVKYMKLRPEQQKAVDLLIDTMLAD